MNVAQSDTSARRVVYIRAHKNFQTIRIHFGWNLWNVFWIEFKWWHRTSSRNYEIFKLCKMAVCEIKFSFDEHALKVVEKEEKQQRKEPNMITYY